MSSGISGLRERSGSNWRSDLAPPNHNPPNLLHRKRCNILDNTCQKKTCLIMCNAVTYGNSRRGYMPKSRYSAISNYSSQISNSIFLKSSAPDFQTLKMRNVSITTNETCIVYEHWPDTREFITPTVLLNMWIILPCYYNRV